MAIAGRPRETRLQFFRKVAYFAPLPFLLGVYIAKYFPIDNLIDNFDKINWLDGIIHPTINEYTSGCVMLCLIIYILIVKFMYEPDNKRYMAEYGSAKWGKWQDYIRKYAVKENSDYQNLLCK